jgi:urea carboxylase system permease
VTTTATRPTTDSDDLAAFGYPQQLRRRLGPYASFAAGFSFVSILTTVFQLFGLGYSFGGPAFVWTWPLVFGGQLLVALVFAELAARYPISGCIYQWSRRVSSGGSGSGGIGWFAGWMMLLGQIVSVAAAAIALQVVLPRIWTGFQLVGGDPALSSVSGATNAVVLGTALIAVTTVVSAIGVRVMSLVNTAGVTCEIVGVTLLVTVLFAHAERGPAVVFRTNGESPYVYGFLASALMAAYVMYGFDSAGELSEETRDPRRTAPRAIVRALAVSGIGGGLLLVAALVASPDLADPRMASEGLPYILTSRLGGAAGTALLATVVVAIVVCTLAIQTAATRLMFSMARDSVLPWSARLAAVSPRTGTPILPGVVVGLAAAAILVVNVGNAQLFAAVTSVAIVMVYVAYLLVTAPLLVRRLRGGWGGPRWRHGVNAGAVLWGIALAANVGWPRAAVYDPSGGRWWLQWFAPLSLAVALGAGALARRRVLRTSG